MQFHGESLELSDDEATELIKPFRAHLAEKMEIHDVAPNCVYNADQTGLYFTKLPNRLYVKKAERKKFAGTKQMKAKERVTLMVCTAADGTKCPLAIWDEAHRLAPPF